MTIFDIIKSRFGSSVMVSITSMTGTSVVTCVSSAVATEVRDFLEAQDWAEGVYILPQGPEFVGFTANVYDSEELVA